jgi:histidine kinase
VIRPFLTARREALEPLGPVIERLWELGDPEYVVYCRFFTTLLPILAGRPLAEVTRSLHELEELRRRVGHRYSDFERYLRMVELLRRPAGSDAIDWDGEDAALHAWIAAEPGCNEPALRTVWMLALCVQGRADLAFAQSERIWTRLLDSNLAVHVVDHTLLRGLSAAILAETARGTLRRRYRRVLRESARKLHRWAADGPDFESMALLLDAERARLRGDRASAHRAYRNAAQRAEQRDFPIHAALAQERLASLLERIARKTEAVSARLQAQQLYETWGAPAKAAALARSAQRG